MCRGGAMYSPTKVRLQACYTRSRVCAGWLEAGVACGGDRVPAHLGFWRGPSIRCSDHSPSPRLPFVQVWRRWHRKINIKQKRYAVASALAASALPSLVMARGHKIDAVPEVPLVVSDAAQSLAKTSAALALLKQVGAMPDVSKSKASKLLHTGKGKMRNRRYTMRRGPLVVYDQDEGIQAAFRNIPGVELAQVERLNLLQLAPGGHLGRFCIWTKAAFAKLDAVFGTQNTVSAQKGGFKVPRSCMSNADLNRVINSDEIQSIVRPPKDNHARAPLKKNPLRNLGAMLKLNPYAKVSPPSPLPAPDATPPGPVSRIATHQFPYWHDARGACAACDETTSELLCKLRHPEPGVSVPGGGWPTAQRTPTPRLPLCSHPSSIQPTDPAPHADPGRPATGGGQGVQDRRQAGAQERRAQGCGQGVPGVHAGGLRLRQRALRRLHRLAQQGEGAGIGRHTRLPCWVL